MARTIRYQPDFRGLGTVMTSREMAAAMEGFARKGQAFAESIAPVETGDYKSRFRTSSATRGTGRRADRAVGYLHNDSDHATLVEFANGDRVLGRTVDAIENGL